MDNKWIADRMSREELQRLAAAGEPPQVSLYLPMIPAYPDSQQNRLLLRSALDEVETQLATSGMPERQVRDWLGPGRDLEHDAEFWRVGGAKGLALLIDVGGARAWRLPYACSESIDVGPHFHLSPLARLCDWEAEFALLALSTNAVRLFRGTSGSLQAIELPAGTPRSESEYLAETDVGRPIRFQTRAVATPGGFQVSSIHGQTSYKDDAKQRLHEYVQVVSREISDSLKSTSQPLILAAVKDLHPVFREAWRGSQLVEPGIHGSPDELSESELHGQALQLLQLIPTGAARVIFERYRHAARTPLASRELEQIVAAAAQGRVDALIAGFGERVWGTWDSETQQVSFRDEVGPPRADLIDVALRETLRHGGDVCVVPRETVPDLMPAVAVLRW